MEKHAVIENQVVMINKDRILILFTVRNTLLLTCCKLFFKSFMGAFPNTKLSLYLV